MANLFDSANAPEVEPLEIQAGDFVQWKRTELHDDYPNDTHTLKYSARLEAAGSTEIEITATASGEDYLVQVPAATTAAYTPGVYHWQAYIIRDADDERIKVDDRKWTVLANFDTDTSDPRSFAQKQLDNIEGLLEGKKDASSFSIAGRSASKFSFDELIQARDYFRAEVAFQRAKNNAEAGRGNFTSVRVRF